MLRWKYLVSLNVNTMMKRFSLFMLLIILLSCKNKATQFEMDYDSKVIIPSSVAISTPFDVNTPEQTTNAEETFAINDTRKDRIESIVLIDLVMTITDPPEKTFSFLNELDIFIKSPSLPEKRVAYRYDIPDNVDDEIICKVTENDLQEYIKAEEFSIRVKATTDELISEDIEINVYTNFLVDAKLIK